VAVSTAFHSLYRKGCLSHFFLHVTSARPANTFPKFESKPARAGTLLSSRFIIFGVALGLSPVPASYFPEMDGRLLLLPLVLAALSAAASLFVPKDGSDFAGVGWVISSMSESSSKQTASPSVGSIGKRRGEGRTKRQNDCKSRARKNRRCHEYM